MNYSPTRLPHLLPCRAGEPSSPVQMIIVNGFLTQDDQEAKDWQEGLAGFNPQIPVQYFAWESKSKKELLEFGMSLLAVARMSRWASLASLVNNPWHRAMLNADKAGQKLAEHLLQAPEQQFILMGHSLGGRVVFSALRALAERGASPVQHAILLGAAVGRKKEKHWQEAASAVQGRIYNCYSSQDMVLKLLYQGANLGLSRPAGLAEAVGPVTNLDFSDRVDRHTRWIPLLPQVLERLELYELVNE